MNSLLKNKLVWVIVIVLVALGIWLGTKGDNKQNAGGSNNQTALSVDSAVQNRCNSQIHDDLFCKFVGAFANIKSYKMTAVDSSGKTVFDVSTDNNGNSAVTASASGQTFNVVSFNGATYVQDPSDSKWIKYSKAPTGLDPSSFDLKKKLTDENNFSKDTNGKALTYKKVGTEACGSLTCYKYQTQATGEKPDFFWFDTTNYLLRKATSNSSGKTVELNVTYSGVTITEPSPVKMTQ